MRRPLRQPHVVGGFEQLGLQQQRTVVGGDQVEAPIQRRRAIEARGDPRNDLHRMGRNIDLIHRRRHELEYLGVGARAQSPAVRQQRALAERVRQLAVEEHQRPLADLGHRRNRRLHHHRLADLQDVTSELHRRRIVRRKQPRVDRTGRHRRLHHDIVEPRITDRLDRLADLRRRRRQQRRHDRHPVHVEFQQIPLVEVPGDQLGRIPQRRALRHRLEPFEKPPLVMHVVPRAADHRQVEALPRRRVVAPTRRGDLVAGRSDGFEQRDEIGIVEADLPRVGGNERDARHERRLVPPRTCPARPAGRAPRPPRTLCRK